MHKNFDLFSSQSSFNRKMRIFALFVLVSLLIVDANAGPTAYALCQTACNAGYVACCAAAGMWKILISIGFQFPDAHPIKRLFHFEIVFPGGTAGVATGGAAVPAAMAGCSVAQGACMASCAAALLAPTVWTDVRRWTRNCYKTFLNTFDGTLIEETNSVEKIYRIFGSFFSHTTFFLNLSM